ncbi:MAG: serine/threonine-protein kinase [Planctomycetota bacterium]
MPETQLGPYRLLSELGSGGMGTVHAAEVADAVPGLDLGSKVAIKVVHPHLLATPGFFKRFLREAELGKTVRHENVVRTLDVDALLVDDQQVHFLVMEYVEGKSLRQLLTDLGTIPETLLREIALQTAAGLAAIHAHGIVHRDLKPENVLITDDHEIRIMDLGVAKLQEASIAITLEGQFAGSLLYAAPEQFGAGEVGPSADLYTLGLTLFELATGDNPFRRDDAAGVMEAHLKLQPPRLTDRSPDTTTFLAELVAKLLAKQPGERFESAQVLCDVLAAGERSRWWTELAPKLRAGVAHLPKIRVRRDTELHGRDAELKLLRDAWENAQGGDGNTVFLEGEAGIGKTRLLDAFVRGLDGGDIHVLYGSYPPSGGLGGLSGAVLDKFGEADLDGVLAPYLTVTPSLVPAFAALMRHEGPPTGAEPLQGDALLAVCAHLARALAEEKPLLWMIEDLHFASRESRDVALALARAVDDHRVLLVATARPGVPDDELANFSRLDSFERVSLGRLGAREVIHLLEDAFKSEALAEKLCGKIAKKSDGVPFFVFEMIRGLKEGQFIRQLPDGSYVQTQVIEDIEVPSAVRDLIEGRLRGLREGQRAILDAGAVCGITFDPGLVAAVLDEKRIRVLRDLADIERRHGLVHGEAGHTRFDQNQIHEVIYRDLTPDLRAEYHTLLAAAYAERLAGEAEGEDAVFLASHHLRGSRPPLGLPHLAAGLDRLESSYRYEEAIELARRALDQPGLLEGTDRVPILLRKAQRHSIRGEGDAARRLMDEALILADESGTAALRADVRLNLSQHLMSVADFASATEHAGHALALAREMQDQKLEGLAKGCLGLVSWHLGRCEEARAHLEDWLAVARESGDRLGEARARGNLGIISQETSRYEEARAHYEAMLAFAREIGDRGLEAATRGNQGAVCATLGLFEEARACHEDSLAVSRERGDRRAEAHSTINLGIVSWSLGRLGEAGTQYEKALALAREIGNRESEGVTLVNLGLLQTTLGQNALARDTLLEALRMLREIGARRPEGYVLDELGDLAAQQGQTEEARRRYEEALALRRDLHYARGQAATLVALARLEKSAGEEQKATTYIEEALSLAEELKIPVLILTASVERARLPGGDLEAALAALAAHEAHVDHPKRLGVRYRLWELANDPTHLAVAHRLLAHMRDHAPEDCRNSMIENVPLHRDIMQAWKEHGNAD